MNHKLVGTLAMVAVIWWSSAPVGQVARTERPPLVAAAEQLRLALYTVTLALLSPTGSDQRLHLQQVINILEGVQGTDFVPLSEGEQGQGLIERITALMGKLDGLAIDPKVRTRARFVAENVVLLLKFARDEAVSALRTRDHAGILKVYSYLYAALGKADPPLYLGGVSLLLRLLPPGAG